MEDSSSEVGKLFVGGLSWETTQENLQHYFSRYGEIIDCVVMKNNETGRSRGFGFVSFSDPNNITQVLEDGHHELDGRTIDPKPCNPRSLRTPSEKVNYPKVFLGGLPSNITETDLRMVFGRFGKVMEVVIMYDQERKKSRGFGFISFESDACVDRAAQLHYITIHGKQVEIKRAEPRQNDNRMHGGNHENAWPSNQQEQRHNYGSPPVYEGYNNPNHYQQAQGQHFQQDYQGNMGGGSNNWSVPSNLNGPPVSAGDVYTYQANPGAPPNWNTSYGANYAPGGYQYPPPQQMYDMSQQTPYVVPTQTKAANPNNMWEYQANNFKRKPEGGDYGYFGDTVKHQKI